MEMKGKGMPGRLKKKPQYNPELQFNDFLEELSNAYEETSSLRILATELNISPLKLRKLLITADVFTSDICTEINNLYQSGKKIPEIMKLTGLSRASVHSYLPYTKGLYNAAELSLNAERCRAYRIRQKQVQILQEMPSEENLWQAIIAVGYRINSERATQFRTWATKVLETFTKQGYVFDKSRLINGQIFDEDYFEHLIAEIQEIRASERRFYQKITDIYATAVDYDKNSQVTREFYATVQNKMHYAVHGNTAAEVIVARADHNKEHMGLKSWKNAPDGKIVKTDVCNEK